MKRLPPAKRNQLIMVVLVTAAVIALVYFALIHPQKIENEQLAQTIGAQNQKLSQIKETIKKADAMSSGLSEVSLQLERAEEDVATGDVFAWTYDTIRRFKIPYHVDISNPSQPTVGDVDLIPDFPYRQVKVTISGTAYYHDLGKFISDFENNFPHMRLVNLTLEPANTGTGEKLSFRVDVIMLVKPTV